jgi:diguanylate cyclase (GGDEF)-like protein
MKKILYCLDKSSQKKVSLPFPYTKTSSLKDTTLKGYSYIVFEEKFLNKRKKLNGAKFKDKVCFIHFSSEAKDNLKIVKRFGFFDYFTDQEIKADIIFKLNRAEKVLDLERRILNLELHLLRKNKKIEQITLIDSLTGCYNWRYFLNRVQQELNRSRRYLHSVSFIGIDIDSFRNVNELYGVEVADNVARELAQVIKSSLRKEDILSRWRGDEFFIVAPHLDIRNAYEVVHRVKKKVDVYKFKHKGVTLRIKVSIGVVTSPEDNVFNARDIISALNKCFSAAKRKGGNAVVFYSQAQFKPMPKETGKPDVKELMTKLERMNALLGRDLLEMIYGFARAIEAKDAYTGEHVEYTAVIAEKIARTLKLTSSEVENIKHAAVLHDLGKVGIDKSILSKKGALSKKEREVIKTHPSIAAEILRGIHALRGAVPAVLYHHERFDGKGYPLGLKGEEIPLSARIVGLADVYQALISDRPYRKAMSQKKALDIIKSESGKQFDPMIVKIFLKSLKEINVKKR